MSFDLVETMRFDPIEGLCLLERHLARIGQSAAELGFAFDRHDMRNALQAATFRLAGPACVRLVLARSGAMAIASGALPAAPAGPVRVWLADRTGDRSHVTTVMPPAPPVGCFDTLFVTPDGLVADGAWTTPFVRDGETLLTPRLAPGMRPGVLRADLIARGAAIEAEVRIDALRSGFLLGNAILGLIPATLG